MSTAQVTTTDLTNSIDFDQVVNILLAEYTLLDKQVDDLPFFTAMPFLRFLWASIKFEFAMVGDIILIIPINIVVFVRNLFPGRWRYVCWTWKYVLLAKKWLWSGECYITIIHFRPLVTLMLHSHFKYRAHLLKRRILLESSFSEDAAKPAIAKIDRACAFWSSTSVGSLILTWTPLALSLGGVLKPLLSFELPDWMRFLGFLSFAYITGVLISAYIVKRGILLGGRGDAAMYPASIIGSGFYKIERTLLRSKGINVSEFPIDAACLFANALVSLISIPVQVNFYMEYLPPDNRLSPIEYTISSAFGAILWLIIVGTGLYRRKKLERE